MKYRLGDLIRQRREKKSENGLPIVGVSRNGFIPPKQIEADTSIYNVFHMHDFVYNPARMELGSIAYNNKYEKAICSSLYEMFYVIKPEVLLPEYLSILISQDKFAEYCNFLGNGSAREYCRFADISEIVLDIPNIDVQKKIINRNKTIKDNIELLEKENIELNKVLDVILDDLLLDKEKESVMNDLIEGVIGGDWGEDESS